MSYRVILQKGTGFYMTVGQEGQVFLLGPGFEPGTTEITSKEPFVVISGPDDLGKQIRARATIERAKIINPGVEGFIEGLKVHDKS